MVNRMVITVVTLLLLGLWSLDTINLIKCLLITINRIIYPWMVTVALTTDQMVTVAAFFTVQMDPLQIQPLLWILFHPRQLSTLLTVSLAPVAVIMFQVTGLNRKNLTTKTAYVSNTVRFFFFSFSPLSTLATLTRLSAETNVIFKLITFARYFLGYTIHRNESKKIAKPLPPPLVLSAASSSPLLSSHSTLSDRPLFSRPPFVHAYLLRASRLLL